MHDPAKWSGTHFVHEADLETARRSHGTDEDLIVVPTHNQTLLRSGPPSPSRRPSKEEQEEERELLDASAASPAA